jgi:outer membrane protein TolC
MRASCQIKDDIARPLFVTTALMVAVAAGVTAVPVTTVAGPAPTPALAAVATVAPIAAAVVEPAAVAEANPDSALAVALRQLAGEPLSLEAAVTEALAQDTFVQTARAELAAAQGAERRERGDFKPELFAEALRISDDIPAASLFAGADVVENAQTQLGAGARVRLPVGTELSASLNTARVTTNSGFVLLSPQYDSFGQLELVQPLLQGFGPAARGERDAAIYTRQQAEARYEDARLATQANVETTYWSLYAAERDYAVQSLIQERATAFLDEVRLRARAGVAGPSEVANAEVFLSGQQQIVLDSEEILDRLSDRLAVLLGRRPASAAGRFRPADQPPASFPVMDQEELVQLVLARSPQVAAGERAVAAARARAAGARRDALPQLDLIGTLGGRGLAGSLNPDLADLGDLSPDTLQSREDTGIGDSVEQVFRLDYPSWSVGMRFVMPFGGGAEAGERDRLAAEVVRAEQELEAIRRNLDAETRTQHRELERGRQRLEIADRGVVASLEQVRIGSLQFQTGRTTAFELVRLGTDLAEAQRLYSAAIIRTARAAATLRRLTAGAYPASEAVGAAQEDPTP